MRTLLLLLLLSACSTSSRVHAPDAVPAHDAFDARFTGATLRFDYHHAGSATEEHVAPRAYRVEGAWPGSRTQLVDASGWGKYRFLVRDAASDGVLWSQGFCSIFGEWETTGEAKTTWRAFEESQRFPEPRAPVSLALEKRGDDGRFHEIWRGSVDPASRFVDRAPPIAAGEVIELSVQGPPATQVDLLLVAEGYDAGGRAKFEADARRLVAALLREEPWQSRRGDVSVRALFLPGPPGQRGISNPRKGVWRRSALACSYNAFDSDRYVLTWAEHALRDLVAAVPYDALAILIDERKYGGGGIYNLWATVAVDTEPAEYVFVHELGHSFAGLADEYYSSQVAYEAFQPPGVEPWEPNATALLDPSALKWRDLVDPGTALPTPWEKERYDALDQEYQKERQKQIAAGAPEEAAEALMRDTRARTAPLLRAEPGFGRVGAYEGCMYESRGLYRPSPDCIMFTRNPVPFCAVCRRAISETIDRFAR